MLSTTRTLAGLLRLTRRPTTGTTRTTLKSRFVNMATSTQEKSVKDLLKRYVPVTLAPDTAHLTAGDKAALGHLVQASRLMDQIFLRQTWSKAAETYEQLKRNESASEESGLLRKYYWLNRGPWSILDEGESFLEGAPHKIKCANYYPEDLTIEEFNNWVATLPEAEQANARGFFHAVRRDSAGKLKLVPYSEEYKDLLEPAAKHLQTAADTVSNASMAHYLRKRAEAFASNDYFDSDVAWMEIDEKSALDVTIGPYEVYRDELFNYKAAFESFVGLRDFVETEKLYRFSDALQDVENNLPIDDAYKNPKLGALSPIVVMNLLFSAGDVGGPQTAAFNLPNDEKVVELKGSKRTMMKNVQEQKFERILRPIADVVIAPHQRHLISFNAFFTHILAHELLHGLGPHSVTKNGVTTSVRSEFQELHSALEEAKADITGLFAVEHFISRGLIPAEEAESFYVTFLASAFRSIRFGLEEAHGKGQAVQLTFLIEKGAFVFDSSSQTFSVDFPKAQAAVTELSHIILTIQAEGAKSKAAELMEKYGNLTQEVEMLLNTINNKNIPVDIAPHFAAAESLV